jgi:hypothetical protein
MAQSKSPSTWFHLGLTIVDSIDTLLILGLDEEYQEARHWVANNLHFDHAGGVSVGGRRCWEGAAAEGALLGRRRQWEHPGAGGVAAEPAQRASGGSPRARPRP